MLVLRPVTSSTIKAIGYQADALALFVLFDNGKLYCYSGVPRSVFDAFMVAPSKGSFLSASIRDRYAFSESSEPYLVASLVSLTALLPGLSFGF